ncbi:LysR family transcriptional regulator [Variovorax sp. CYS-02]|uniref:LysR family transcriptional regulator n=2 Tax=Variovorax terrae TaxID=2923278 RepID=A0A9X2APD7_9BURK|nr:LysR family transcriptional regulator [Variovorax terrae]
MKIAEAGNLHVAAAALGVTQPALTKLVRRLETSLDVRLLERTARGVALTEFGRVLYARSKTLQQVADDTLTEIGDMKSGRSGQLRLGAVPTAVDTAVAPVLKNLLTAHDPIRFFVTVQLSSRLLQDLQAGLLDFAIASIPAQVPDELCFLPLWQQQTHVVSRKGHWLQRRPFTLEDLSQQPWLLPPANIVLRTWVDSMFTSAGLAPPKVFVEADASPAALATLVRTSDVLTAMSIDTLNTPMGSGLAVLAPPAGAWTTHLGLFWRRSAYFSRLMERCRDSLLAAVDQRSGAAKA